MGPVQGAGRATLPEATRGAVHERTFFELSWSHVTWVSSTGGSLVGIGGACSHRLAARAAHQATRRTSHEIPPLCCNGRPATVPLAPSIRRQIRQAPRRACPR